MVDFYKKIIDEAIWAPSGDNSQPWYFRIHNNLLEVYVTPEVDHPILNVNNSGSYIAHGALLENLDIAAKEFGKKIGITLFPDINNLKLLATIEILGDIERKDPLFKYIKKRHTNRKQYKDIPLDSIQKDLILKSVVNIPNISFVLTESYIDKKRIAIASSAMEKISLENKELHRLFFGDIIWNKDDNINGKTGLYIKTLELPLPIQKLFILLKNWIITELLNKIGFSKIASQTNSKIYSSGAAIGLITIPNRNPSSFVDVGRALQRIWLTVTSFGMYLQPITGILFLAERILNEEYETIDIKHKKLALASNDDIKKVFGITNEIMAMLFRIGKSDLPTEISYRRLPTIYVDTQ